ncbi:NRAMP family divalent metal transporter [Caulobacter sp. KR2-114]|uniref:NRAMP family divalent metal transporter n=1 Tax=Caulobacter sp. KR2-114 TaxID=3400912 RepID=UPI003C022B90
MSQAPAPPPADATPPGPAHGLHDRAVEAFKSLGPGLITGAADDDPSGIATYSQAGAQFGTGLLWTVVITYPLMAGFQQTVAEIGRVTGEGLAANMRKVFPRWLLTLLLIALMAANTINIAADVAAMGEAAGLLLPKAGITAYTIGFGLLCLVLEVFISYRRYASILKWLTLTLLTYVAIIFTVKAPWAEVARGALVPNVALNRDALTMVVAVFGTTISPYLFFWQSSQEVEELDADDSAHALKTAPAEAPGQLRRITLDTWIGMAVSNVVAFFIMLTTALTLHAHGITDIATSAQAASALKPIAGPFAFFLFAMGVIGTGMLAVPVLAGSAAYAVAEARGWRHGLDRKVKEARGFYAIIALATLGGLALVFIGLDPIKALVWAAVVNGFVAVPIMAVTMLVVTRKEIMGEFCAPWWLVILGWAATGLMAVAAIGMVVI